MLILLRPRCRSLQSLLPRHSEHHPNRSHLQKRTLLTLAIESSCDDTAVAVLSHTSPSTTLLFNERISSDNRAFKGVHPVISVQGHNSSLAPLVQRALQYLPDASPSTPSIRIPSNDGALLMKQRPDFVSVTRGPGIMANLAVGLNMAKGLATARVILPADVLDASPDVMYGRLLESFAFPNSPSHEQYSFFEPAASRSDEINTLPTGYAWDIPLPFRNTRRLAYSFSSIHTRVHRIAASNPSMPLDERRSLARHTMRAAFQHLCSRLVVALEDRPELRPAARTIVVSGGVASNKFLMHVLKETLRARGYPDTEIIAPPVKFCTDNAAMIAWTGMEMFEKGWRSDLGVLPVGKWPMEMDGADGDGILGVGGWIKKGRA
ncbi:tRNA N6-adenosine threonylcarbamoyltransferase, mitochondrial [Metarhizium anisopliae]